MHPLEIDEVVLVGGTTRVPKIKELLREYFEKDVNDHIDPDVTVCLSSRLTPTLILSLTLTLT